MFVLMEVLLKGNEYWSARDLYKLLGYSRWEKFQKSIEEAQVACDNSKQVVSDRFHLEVKMVGITKLGKRCEKLSSAWVAPCQKIYLRQRKAFKRWSGKNKNAYRNVLTLHCLMSQRKSKWGRKQLIALLPHQFRHEI